jgi:peroxiredoxin family protein
MSEKSMTIIASKGTLDWAYPPFILSSTAAALGYNVNIFFTFYGLQLLKKNLSLSVSPLGNPGMPMPMGMDKWFPVLGTAIPWHAGDDDRHDEEHHQIQGGCQRSRAAQTVSGSRS